MRLLELEGHQGDAVSRQIVVQSCGEHSGGLSTAGKAKRRRTMVNAAAKTNKKPSVIQNELVNAPGADRSVIPAKQISRKRSQLAAKKNQHRPETHQRN